MSLSWTVNCHEARGTNECLRRVTIWSNTTRNPGPDDFYHVRVGVGRSGKVDWIGTYDGSSQKLEARTYRDLTGTVTVDRVLAEGETLLVEVQRHGSPLPSAVGLTVEWHLDRVGGNSQRPAALFQMAGWIPDGSVRSPVEGLVGQLNNSGVAGWTIPVHLADPAVESINETYPRVVYSTGDAELITTTAAEQTVFSYTVPANVLVPGRSYRLVLYGIYLNNTGSNQTITLKAKYGSTTLVDDATQNIGTAAAYRAWEVALDIAAGATAQAQTACVRLGISASSAATAGTGDFANAGACAPYPFYGSASEDACLAKDLVVTWTNSASSSNLHQYIYFKRLELA